MLYMKQKQGGNMGTFKIKVEVKCDGCGVTFLRAKSMVAFNKRNGKRNYHTRECIPKAASWKSS